MIPERFRRSALHRTAFATMDFLAEHDPAGPWSTGAELAKSSDARRVLKAAVSRKRTLLEARAEDDLRAYAREERAHVVAAARAGRDPEAAVKSLQDDLSETLERVWRHSTKSWLDWTARTSPLRAKAKAVDPHAKVDKMIDDWLKRNLGKRVTGINETRRAAIAAQVQQGRKAGEGVAEIARRLDKFYLDEIIPGRSLVIARTEVGMATNFTQYLFGKEASAQADAGMDKEWMALDDDRTRDDHADADGQTVDMDDTFQVGGDELRFPGDPSGSPEEVINCRCSLLYHVREEKRKAAPLSPAEFAKSVAGIDSPDVAVALAYAAGVFGEGDEWTEARGTLMKHVNRIKRAAAWAEKAWDDMRHPRDERGRFVEGAGLADMSDRNLPSYDADNQRAAEAARKYQNGTVVRYTGGSKVALNPGEHVVVRGVYGMSKGGGVYYNVEAAGGRRFTIADRTIRLPEAGETSAEPAAPRPVKPREPRPAEPRPAEPRPAPPPPEPKPTGPDTRPPADYTNQTKEQIAQRFYQRHGVRLTLTPGTTPEGARYLADHSDRLLEKYPFMKPGPGAERLAQVREVRVQSGKDMRAIFKGSPPYGYANDRSGAIVLREDHVNAGDRTPESQWGFGKGMTFADGTRTVGFHPDGCDTAASSLDHEFGHQIDFHLMHAATGTAQAWGADQVNRGREWNAFKDKHASAELSKVSGYARNSYGTYGRGKKLYGFGAQDKHLEPVAESFSQYEAREKGYYKGKLEPGAARLGDFLRRWSVGAHTDKPLTHVHDAEEP